MSVKKNKWKLVTKKKCQSQKINGSLSHKTSTTHKNKWKLLTKKKWKQVTEKEMSVTKKMKVSHKKINVSHKKKKWQLVSK